MFQSGSPLISVGGVKRPAEGSREEPSEKKNLPVLAKTFVPKAAENRSPPSVHPVAQTSTKVAGAAAQVTECLNSHFLSQLTGTVGEVPKSPFFHLMRGQFYCYFKIKQEGEKILAMLRIKSRKEV